MPVSLDHDKANTVNTQEIELNVTSNLITSFSTFDSNIILS